MAGSLTLLRHQELEYRAQASHDLVINIGGVGSGKTTSFVMWLLDRMRRPADVAQVHALFAYTLVQLRAVTDVVYKQIARLGIERTFNTRPPVEWLREWDEKGIVPPPRRDRYENMVIWRTGLHLQLGTLFAYEQYRGAEWGSIGIEEFTLRGVKQEAIDFVFERTRCGEGPDFCRENHRHTKILHGNPPEAPDHWTWAWLDQLEKAARDEQLARGRKALPAVEGGFPHLMNGIGTAILIPSRSTDNVANLPPNYIENQLIRLDKDTAARRLGGALTRSKIGRAYCDYSQANEIPVGYDPSRTLYVFFDFNKDPAVAGFAQQLNPQIGSIPSEYPAEHHRAGITHIGVFGEFFHVGGMDAYEMANAILRGEPGSGGHFPSNWKGLANHQGPIVAFGDVTARNKRMAGPNEWQIVNDVLRNGTKRDDSTYRYSVNLPEGGNPLVVFGVRSVNAKFCSAAGVRSLWIDPRCQELIADMLVCTWDPSGTDIQKYGMRPGSKMGLRTHLGDGLRYMIHQLFPLGREQTSAPSSAPEAKRNRVVIPEF